MIFEPRPWQKPMIDHIMNHRRMNLWAGMGTGKTSATLTAFEILQMCGSNFFPALILAPKRVARDVWPVEGVKWDHLRRFKMVPIIGDVKDRRRALHMRADIFTMNYDNIPWLVEQLGDKWPFRTVVADESTRLKGYRSRGGGKRAAALAAVARKSHRWINLTGTPASNGLKDLWGQNYFVDFGERLGRTYTDFKSRWFDYNQWTQEVTPKQHAQEQIQKAMADITLSIEIKDYMDIREPIFVPVWCNMPKEAMAQYKQLEHEMFAQLKDDIELTALSAAAKSTKCLQFASGAVYYEGRNWTDVHDEKLDALESIIEETAGANLLVAYWWKHDAERICKRFKQARILKTKQDEDDWNAGRISLLLSHPQSAGHGLNLQSGGHHIVFFSDWWNLEAHLQIIERIGPTRQMQSGFDRPVYVYQILTRGTVDEDVRERHDGKTAIQDILMNAMKRRQG